LNPQSEWTAFRCKQIAGAVTGNAIGDQEIGQWIAVNGFLSGLNR
jgi:hypothetical protein